ncbi:tryptophan 2,3-dioxygenase family protein [Streptomyces johnsoniae]|uniref:Tryptophan 2,3-dioxygenase family protein n=1 Tax=Streptomyces johnsoniae TaxID=3075532 RepID=A0ABU2SEY5_9ACTN|nr:tryptophan 2,3-dioxygenase family protein [Streptomyces sp. DSM 41886]MDT0446660.1 tryptophan 2,3-dioxygenase family protein [Streptomyces sp. DSM 41886]
MTEPGPTYSSYLRIAELLALQSPSAARVHDERLFITVHQVQELWFAQLLTELADARDLMLDGEPRRARLRLARCLEIDRALIAGLRPLHTMPPREFHAFRGHLGTASGAQSAQYREIESLSGATWARSDRLPTGLAAAEGERLRRRNAEPSLWDGFLTLLGKAGFDMATRESRRTAFAHLAAHPDDLPELTQLAETLLDHDTVWAEWRAAHTLLVERQIGALPGSGGSTGAPHLRAGMHRRFFPELWESGTPDPLTATPH